MATVKGYKVFNPDWTCRDKQYTCPGRFTEDVTLELCNSGMHFCTELVDCFTYYPFLPGNHVAEVIAHGDVVNSKNKYCTNDLEVVRELSWFEVLEKVNTGKYCVGIGNSGSYNTGGHNSGQYNSGCRNTGNCNTGDENSGHYNSGDYNTGMHNTGNHNSGNWNSGDWNTCDGTSGCFNTTKISKIYLFNKPSEWTYETWADSGACLILSYMPTVDPEWVCYEEMSKEEKKTHPEAECREGYLRTNQTIRQIWWDGLCEGDKQVVLSIPNFDSTIFKQITGIDVGG
jgi:hypothetical protein